LFLPLEVLERRLRVFLPVGEVVKVLHLLTCT
jgi:hypothetical protein